MEDRKKLKLGILGGTKAHGSTAKDDLLYAFEMGKQVWKEFPHISVFTGGLAGFPRQFSKGFCKNGLRKNTQKLCHILPKSSERTHSVRNKVTNTDGQVGCVYAFEGANWTERRTILATKKGISIALCMGGGQGTIDEVEKCLGCGVSVIFLVRAGGACARKKKRRKVFGRGCSSGGEYEIPREYLKSPLADRRASVQEMCSYTINELKRLYTKDVK